MKKSFTHPGKIAMCIFAIVSLICPDIKAQLIHIVPNPDSIYVFSLSDVVYNDKLYVQNIQGTLSTLAEYDGHELKAIGNGKFDVFLPLLPYKNELYMHSRDHLAKYDGNTFTLIANDDLMSIVPLNQTPIVFNNKLYTYCRYEGNDIAHFDGTSLVVDSNLSNRGSFYVDEINTPSEVFVVYKNNLIFSKKQQLAQFDGDTMILFPNPGQGGSQSRFDHLYSEASVIYNDLLYVPFSTYIASKNDYIMQLAQFDGKKLELIPNPNKGDGYNGDPIVVNNILYFLYGSSNWEYGSPHNSFPHLAKFDGKLITLISNPDKGHYIRGSQVEYNSNLYLTYINALGISHLARYDGSKLQLLPNPDKGNGFNGTLFVYNGKLFSGYRNAKGIQQLAVYDGHLFKLIFGPGRRGKYGFSDPVIYKNKLFFDWDSNLAYLE